MNFLFFVVGLVCVLVQGNSETTPEARAEARLKAEPSGLKSLGKRRPHGHCNEHCSPEPTDLCQNVTAAACPCCPFQGQLVIQFNFVDYSRAECACSKLGLELAELKPNELKEAGVRLTDCLGKQQKSAWVQGFTLNGLCPALNGTLQTGYTPTYIPCDSSIPVYCRAPSNPLKYRCYLCRFQKYEWCDHCPRAVRNSAVCYTPDVCVDGSDVSDEGSLGESSCGNESSKSSVEDCRRQCHGHCKSTSSDSWSKSGSTWSAPGSCKKASDALMLIDELLPIAEAKNRCKALGGHLAIVEESSGRDLLAIIPPSQAWIDSDASLAHKGDCTVLLGASEDQKMFLLKRVEEGECLAMMLPAICQIR